MALFAILFLSTHTVTLGDPLDYFSHHRYHSCKASTDDIIFVNDMEIDTHAYCAEFCLRNIHCWTFVVDNEVRGCHFHRNTCTKSGDLQRLPKFDTFIMQDLIFYGTDTSGDTRQRQAPPGSYESQISNVERSESHILCKYLQITSGLLVDDVLFDQLTPANVHCWEPMFRRISNNGSTFGQTNNIIELRGRTLSSDEVRDIFDDASRADVLYKSARYMNNFFVRATWFRDIHQVTFATMQIGSPAFCLPHNHSAGPESGEVTWPATSTGSTARSVNICLSSGRPKGSRECILSESGMAHWSSKINWSVCRDDTNDVTKTLHNIWKDLEAGNSSDEATSVVANITRADNLSAVDLILTSKIVQRVVNSGNLTRETGDSLVSISDAILDKPTDVLREAETLDGTTTRILTSLDDYVKKVDLAHLSQLKIVKPNLAVHLTDIQDDTSDLQMPLGYGMKINTKINDNATVILTEPPADDTMTELEIAVFVPRDLIRTEIELSEKRKTRLSFFIYRKAGLFQTHTHSKVDSLNSWVISASLSDKRYLNLSSPITMLFHPLQEGVGNECVFWQFKQDKRSDWSTAGCQSRKSHIDQRHICLCDHMTNFAIIFKNVDFDTDTKKAMEVISAVGLSLSVLGLSVTLLAFLLIRRLQKSALQKVLFNLALSLLISDVIFVLGSKKSDNVYLCTAIAAMFVYFLLVAFMWMAVEGIIHFLALVKSFITTSQVAAFLDERFKVATAIAWTIPAVVVGVAFLVEYLADVKVLSGSTEYCMPDQFASYFVLALPIALVVSMNLVIYSLVMKRFCCQNPDVTVTCNQKDSVKTYLQIRVSMAAMVVMGVTYIFGFLSILETRSSLVMTYLHCIFNSLQGLFIFIMFITREKDIRQKIKQTVCRHRKSQPFSGHKTASSAVGHSNLGDNTAVASHRTGPHVELSTRSIMPTCYLNPAYRMNNSNH